MASTVQVGGDLLFLMSEANQQEGYITMEISVNEILKLITDLKKQNDVITKLFDFRISF